MNNYDKLGTFLYETIISKEEGFYNDIYAVSLSYSHDGKNWNKSLEVFELDICDGCICWFNDWYEGEPFIKLNGIMNLNVLFYQGFYRTLLRKFNNENID